MPSRAKCITGPIAPPPQAHLYKLHGCDKGRDEAGRRRASEEGQAQWPRQEVLEEVLGVTQLILHRAPLRKLLVCKREEWNSEVRGCAQGVLVERGAVGDSSTAAAQRVQSASGDVSHTRGPRPTADPWLCR